MNTRKRGQVVMLLGLIILVMTIGTPGQIVGDPIFVETYRDYEISYVIVPSGYDKYYVEDDWERAFLTLSDARAHVDVVASDVTVGDADVVFYVSDAKTNKPITSGITIALRPSQGGTTLKLENKESPVPFISVLVKNIGSGGIEYDWLIQRPGYFPKQGDVVLDQRGMTFNVKVLIEQNPDDTTILPISSSSHEFIKDFTSIGTTEVTKEVITQDGVVIDSVSVITKTEQPKPEGGQLGEYYERVYLTDPSGTSTLRQFTFYFGFAFLILGSLLYLRSKEDS